MARFITGTTSIGHFPAHADGAIGARGRRPLVRKVNFVLAFCLLAACGGNERAAAGLSQFTGFTVVRSREISNFSCRYDLTYNRGPLLEVTKTCPSYLDSNMVTRRTYTTTLGVSLQKELADSLDQLQSEGLPSETKPTECSFPPYDDYDLQVLRASGGSVAVHLSRSNEDKLSAGLQTIYSRLLDGDIRITQNANDAYASLKSISDDTAVNTPLSVAIPTYAGGLALACMCDGDDGASGSSAGSHTIDGNGTVERWSGCLRRGTYVGDPNRGLRCHTDQSSISMLAPSQWNEMKRMILSADPLSLASDYPCGSYLDCPSDFDTGGLTINIGFQGPAPYTVAKAFSWPLGTEDQLPAKLQYILSVLP